MDDTIYVTKLGVMLEGGDMLLAERKGRIDVRGKSTLRVSLDPGGAPILFDGDVRAFAWDDGRRFLVSLVHETAPREADTRRWVDMEAAVPPTFEALPYMTVYRVAFRAPKRVLRRLAHGFRKAGVREHPHKGFVGWHAS